MSRDLGGTKSIKFYNEQAELCRAWYILSDAGGVS